MWSTRVVGFHVRVLWQASQVLVLLMWPAGLPVALVPLWQVAQVPGATPLWSKTALDHEVVVWQSSQVLALAM